MKLTKEQIESMHTLLVRERPMGTSVAAVDELCRLALLGLERDERQAVTSEQAAKDIKILEQIHAKSWDEAVALRHAAEALSERDERAERIGRAVLAQEGDETPRDLRGRAEMAERIGYESYGALLRAAERAVDLLTRGKWSIREVKPFEHISKADEARKALRRRNTRK